jgi:RimJ/RimL family protein N-acetyltransferase
MIDGREVSLRPVEESDFPLIHAWMNHPEVWRYMDYELPFSMADVKEDVERSRKEGQPFTITVQGRPIGRIGLNRFRRRDRICALYMFIGEPAFWGKGYARDAVMTLLAYAFERHDLNQVELWTLGDNNRALAMYAKCGFEAEAHLRMRSFKHGAWVDHVVMSVTRDDFAAAKQAWDEPGIVTRDSGTG